MAKEHPTKYTPRFKDETGNVYGKLTVISRDSERGASYWMCKCECGSVKSVRIDHLREGRVKSCSVRCSTTTHHMHKSTEYSSWQCMKNRCLNSNSTAYKYYGARGIKVCERWMNSFEYFYDDMGPKPFAGASVERIDNDGIYEPKNCKWASPGEQSDNSRRVVNLTHNGKTQSISKWSRELGINVGTLIHRLRRGWSIEKALTAPIDIRCHKKPSTPP